MMQRYIVFFVSLLLLVSTTFFYIAQSDDTPATQPSSDIAGSKSCRECHEDFYTLWAPSHHGLAMQPYTDEYAQKNLTGQKSFIEIQKIRYKAEVGSGQGWVIEKTDGEEKKLKIVHVLGGKNVYYFLTPIDRGRLQTLPVAYDVNKKEWFDTAASGMRHAADEPVHWTESPYTFNTACYSCHVSQLSTNYNLDDHTYHTVWAEPGINCETCHGPAQEHVELFKSIAPGEIPSDLRIIETGDKFTPKQNDAVCAPCHAKMQPITTSFMPGDRFFDHYNLTTLEHSDFYPDGRDLGENYTFTLWRMNPCVKAGEMQCIHCHTSSGRYRFHGENANNACMPCHEERVTNSVEHTRHPKAAKATDVSRVICR
jgi:hypothetical protein